MNMQTASVDTMLLIVRWREPLRRPSSIIEPFEPFEPFFDHRARLRPLGPSITKPFFGQLSPSSIAEPFKNALPSLRIATSPFIKGVCGDSYENVSGRGDNNVRPIFGPFRIWKVAN